MIYSFLTRPELSIVLRSARKCFCNYVSDFEYVKSKYFLNGEKHDCVVEKIQKNYIVRVCDRNSNYFSVETFDSLERFHSTFVDRLSLFQ